MSSISISSTLPALAPAVTKASAKPASAQPQPTTNASADTVQLSESQQVNQLYSQGQAISQIATSLSLSVSDVHNYLGITAT
jgi:DNA-binding NarL/FixJ family response regulator